VSEPLTLRVVIGAGLSAGALVLCVLTVLGWYRPTVQVVAATTYIALALAAWP
jgi:hypothetical protein